MNCNEVNSILKSLGNQENVAGMARFGITPVKAFGVSMPELRKLGKRIGTDHELALRLWQSGFRESSIVAGIIDEPRMVTDSQLETWISDFDNWEIVDQTCMNLFSRLDTTFEKSWEWCLREEEYVGRAGFSLAAILAVRDKKASDKKFRAFFPIIESRAGDERNTVMKAVNWALRQIGKRNLSLNVQAVKTAQRIKKQDTRSARWIASDALRELTSEKVIARLEGRNGR